MCGAIPPLSHYIFMAWCLVKPRDNFTFTILPLCEISKQPPDMEGSHEYFE
jgi:hypothetical protein